MSHEKDNQVHKIEIQQPVDLVSKKYASRSRIYVRAVEGIYQKLRQRIGFIFMALFMVMPWLQYNDRQALLFDIEQQQFHIFSMTLWPQDLTILVFIFIIAAFALFVVTTFLGRVWCGYTCPQTVWTFIFMWFEEKLEGSRHQRMKLDKQPNDFNKVWRKTAKHASWIGFSLFTSLTFIGYFTPIDKLFVDFLTFNSTFWYAFWVLFFTFCTYGNAGWMREIMCTHICPYARFQSAMFDKDTFTVSYDANRGENRGPRGRKQDPKDLGLGDCIDCNLCVQVCPTGIDIRNGLQYECINCGACIDACDGVMEKMRYEKGLISYTTEHALEGKPTKLFRSKLMGYLVILTVMTAGLIYNIASRVPFELDILRDRGQLYRETFTGEIENTYTLKILNKSQQEAVFTLSTRELPEAKWLGDNAIKVAPGHVTTLPISLVVDPYLLDMPINDFNFVIKAEFADGTSDSIEQESRFFKR
ncbi:cytochrome c oxidase accessory protein CcoG [Catenovulum sp. SM1970]|uniref:cytochrome c oxidase accessory protein CcoG n=1 Tax=Marinifaba aquimaris TaxID=2741323 RepID=UPI001571D98D|nr:cytochrome c oxidase accessory protein CcoG [Marinifaba aquimaris]NTS76827.1 cytochrome c oxidase accessory protein CcoG [Marinifaba aquimaris]